MILFLNLKYHPFTFKKNLYLAVLKLIFNLDYYAKPFALSKASQPFRTDYIICGISCKIKMWAPCSKIINSFRIATSGH